MSNTVFCSYMYMTFLVLVKCFCLSLLFKNDILYCKLVSDTVIDTTQVHVIITCTAAYTCTTVVRILWQFNCMFDVPRTKAQYMYLIFHSLTTSHFFLFAVLFVSLACCDVSENKWTSDIILLSYPYMYNHTVSKWYMYDL